jgi:hypothetical protein
MRTGQLTALGREYNRRCSKGLEPLAQFKSDTARHEIDNAISSALQIPAFPFIRDLLDREPGLTAIGINKPIPPTNQTWKIIKTNCLEVGTQHRKYTGAGPSDIMKRQNCH